MTQYFLAIDEATWHTYTIGQSIHSVTPSPSVIANKIERDGRYYLVFDTYVAGSAPGEVDDE